METPVSQTPSRGGLTSTQPKPSSASEGGPNAGRQIANVEEPTFILGQCSIVISKA
jgi:hypothetical protein